jgi:hypothetical protein
MCLNPFSDPQHVWRFVIMAAYPQYHDIDFTNFDFDLAFPGAIQQCIADQDGTAMSFHAQSQHEVTAGVPDSAVLASYAEAGAAH